MISHPVVPYGKPFFFYMAIPEQAVTIEHKRTVCQEGLLILHPAVPYGKRFFFYFNAISIASARYRIKILSHKEDHNGYHSSRKTK